MPTTISGEVAGQAATVSNPLAVNNIAQLVPEAYDYIALTYVSAGNGVGEVETVVYKTGGSGGTTVATLTLTYDSDNNVSSVERS